jgi:hypothetical protein
LKVGLLIPAYNVEDQVGAVIEGARPWVDRILVLDDGSSDHTREKALGLGTEVISNKPNRGKGYALKQGFAYFRFSMALRPYPHSSAIEWKCPGCQSEWRKFKIPGLLCSQSGLGLSFWAGHVTDSQSISLGRPESS